MITIKIYHLLQKIRILANSKTSKMWLTLHAKQKYVIHYRALTRFLENCLIFLKKRFIEV